jgi:hypothetical protein
MLDVLTFCWFDPHLEGPRQRPRHVPGAQIRPDLTMSRRRARKTGVAFTPPPRAAAPVDGLAPRAFKPAYINRLAQLFKKHLPVEHRFVCVADSTEGFTEDVHVIETPPEALEIANWRSPEGNRFPSCYRRLWAQGGDAAKMLSERVLLIDADLIPVRDCSPIVLRSELFVGWRPFRDWGRKLRIGGGIYLFTPGVYATVWDRFRHDPRGIITAARNEGFRGSDQAVLSYFLADKVAIYGRDTGIYSIRDLDQAHTLPRDARLVQFNGPVKPWDYRGPATWVADHWRGR